MTYVCQHSVFAPRLLRLAPLTVNTQTFYRRKNTPAASSLFDSPNIHVVDGVDVTNDTGAGCLVHALEEAGNPKVDVLINNAGVMSSARNTLDIDVLRESMEVNAYGALRITTAL